MKKYTIGLDFGTDSVRSLLVDVEDGREICSSVFEYPRWKEGLYCNPTKNQFRQHPMDYIESLENVIIDALKMAPSEVADNVIGISVDTTGSTPCAIDEKGAPLSLTAGFEDNPNAMFVLWKDHTAVNEADEINVKSANWETDYRKYVGGIYSSEWFWSKILHISRTDPAVLRCAYSWVEHCDWISALLTGTTRPGIMKRSRCAAGHKAMWHEEFNGLPSEEFLVSLDPVLSGLRDRLYRYTYTCDTAAGNLTREWADRLGLPVGIPIGVGAFDAHLGAVGGEIQPYYLSKIMGTSTCDILVAPMEKTGDKLIAGICGQVEGSVIPGMLGMEAGQSAFGDIYAWFKNVLLWPTLSILQKTSLVDSSSREKLVNEISDTLITRLSEEASKIPVSESSVLALDWMNGRRTPDANQNLKGAITGLNLASDAPLIFRALVEATAFGSKAIADRFAREGVPMKGVIAMGGVAKKSPLVMQIVSDVMNMPIQVVRSEQACALGSAMAAAVVAGVYKTIDEARVKMGGGFENEYFPITENVEKYEALYQKYLALGEFIEISQSK